MQIFDSFKGENLMYTPSFDYFIEIAKALNFSVAAKKAHVSQQNLSTYMQRLESHYGVKLVERKPVMRLTKAGELTLEAAEKIEDILNELSGEISRLNRGAVEPITVGTERLLDETMMKALPLVEFRKQYPYVSFVVITDSHQQHRENLRSGKIDIFAGPYQTSYDREHISDTENLLKEFNIIDLFDENECVVISDSLLKQYFPDRYPQCIDEFSAGVEVGEFAEVPSVMYLPCPIRNKIDRYCNERKIKLNIAVETGDVFVGKQFIKNGLAYGLLSASSAREIPEDVYGGKIYAFPITAPDVWRKIGIFYRKQNEYLDYFKALIDMIIDKNKTK